MDLSISDPIDVHIHRTDLGKLEVRPAAVPDLQEGQILLAVDRFALSANNLSYAGTDFGAAFWDLFPAPAPWGRLPVWGFATVARSRHPLIAHGERVFGLLPMSTCLVVEPGEVTRSGFCDTSGTRASSAAPYRRYARSAVEPAREDLHAVLRPLFFTSFVLDDHLAGHGFFGARTVLLSSASSKTALGTAFLLRQRGRVHVCGLSSARHGGFVRSTGCFDQVLAYEQLHGLMPALPVAYVDFSGDAALRQQVHRRFGAQLACSLRVGATHRRPSAEFLDLTGPPVRIFFGPAEIEKRRTDWGGRTLLARLEAASLRFEAAAAPWLAIAPRTGLGQFEPAYFSLLHGTANPAEAFVVWLDGEALATIAEEHAVMRQLGLPLPQDPETAPAGSRENDASVTKGVWAQLLRGVSNQPEECPMKSVSELLKRRDSSAWRTVPEATVLDALGLLALYEVGALMVIADGTLVGVVSERDCARKVDLQGKSSKSVQVSEIMTPNVMTVTPTTRTRECMSLMSNKRIRHLPVVDAGKVIGMISIRDLMDDIIADHEQTIDQLRAYIQA
ncbi:DUF2855 family protein [Variovorax saccharolyticus]|uniref:DUF2855 family protein n=1 Tax=Variovorax saccharolyticus TaxID=3053516 RepID=UPI0025788FF1|nr:DUF2855 family protein [Variovorax sp. J22R187]MDM0019021.1 DUF2855 family protein [Variovorax sp. J22R187]